MRGDGSDNGVRNRVTFVPAFLIVQRNGVIRINPSYRRWVNGKQRQKPKDKVIK